MSAANSYSRIPVAAHAENLQKVPLTISAYSSEELANVGVDRTHNLQPVIASLVDNNTSAFFQPFVRRGAPA